ncbi:MAG: hypothetical protein AAFQ62_07500 [Pseudomonadota bacterium]
MVNNELRNDPVAQEAEEALYGENHAWLRSQRARRWLVVVAGAAIILSTASRLADWPFLALPAILVFLASWVGLRIAVRKIIDLPDQYIDERMRERRGIAYRHAYAGIGALLSVIMLAHIALTLLAKYQGWPSMTGEVWFELSFTMVFSMMILPNAVYAWTERDI